jgi:peptidoglycan/LPS O-acetylase OafA/YrhL
LLGASIVIFDLEKIPARIQSLLLILTSVVFLGSGIYLFRNEFGEIESAVIVYLRNFGYSFVNMRYQWPFIVLNLFLFTLVLTLVAAKKGMISRWLNNFFQLPALVSIGRVSYGMYVIHMGLIPVLGFYKNKVSFFDNGYVYSLFYCLIVYMLAVLLYHLFEKRFLSLKVRFT